MNDASRYGVNEAGKPLLPEFGLINVSKQVVNEDAVIDQIYDLKAHYEAEFVRLYKAMEAGGDIDHFKAMYFTHGVVVGLALAFGDSFDEAMGDSLRALLPDEEGGAVDGDTNGGDKVQPHGADSVALEDDDA